ncbi:nucleolar pre-ribosomal-associated protein 1-like [Sycon ciliatum]|uniref:nucleolar pre-ribosomal-associated protein 1-like n=1 Tax=Sycon ciliatum TaxID=27933 RepID=UPI0031F6E961
MENADATAINLSKFISQCSSEGSQEHLNAYCRDSPQCNDLFAVLDRDGSQQQPTPKELQLVFQALEHVLLYTAALAKDASSGLAGVGALRAVGQTVVAKLLQNHMKMIYHSLNTASPSYLVRSCLKLLIAVCVQGSESTRQLCGVLDLGFKPLQMLPSRRDAKSADDIRGAFVKFCIALLLYGDADIIRVAMESKVLLSSLFRLLPSDRPLVVHMMLSTLLDKVLKNPSVTKKSKLEFFNSNVLLLISKLCQRFQDTLSQASTDSEDGSEVKQVTVASLAAGFLHTVCCSSVHGIGFASKYQASGECNNPILLRFLTSIHVTDRNALVDELIISTLSTYPDLLHSYWSAAAFSLEPRPSHVWLGNVKLAINVLESVECPPLSLVSAASSAASDDLLSAKSIFVDAPTSSLDDMPVEMSSATPWQLLGTLVPSSLTSTMIGHGMQHSNGFVKLSTLQLQALVLRRADRFLVWCRSASQQFLHNGKVNVSSTSLSSKDIDLVASAVHDAVTQLVPNINVLTAVCQQVLNSFNAPVDAASLQLDSTNGQSPPEFSHSDLLSAILECLVSYHSLVPSCFIQTGYDLCKLLAPVSLTGEAGPASELQSFLSLPFHIQALIMQLLLQAAPNSIQWHKPMAKMSFSPLNVIIKSYIGALIASSSESEDESVDSAAGDCLSTAERLLIKLTRETEVVGNGEVSDWLRAIRHLHSDGCPAEDLIALIEQTESVFCGLVSKPHTATTLWSDFTTAISYEASVPSDEPLLSVEEILRNPMCTQRLTAPSLVADCNVELNCSLLLLALDRLSTSDAAHQQSVCLNFVLKYIPLCLARADEPKLVSKYVKHFSQSAQFSNGVVMKKLLRVTRETSSTLGSSMPGETESEDVEEKMDVDETRNGDSAGEDDDTVSALKLKYRPKKDNWSDFVSNTLECHFGHPAAFLYLAELVPQVYQANSPSQALAQLPLDKMHQMLMSHSLFLETLLVSSPSPAQPVENGAAANSDECREAQQKLKVKDALVTLLLAIVQAGSSACTQAHITVFLAAYSPYLTATDSKLLKILHLYEKSFSLSSVRMSLWGDTALAYLRSKATQGDDASLTTLWTEGCMDRVLQLLDRATLLQSILHIPLDICECVEAGTFPAVPGCNVYDPRFLLPLFAESLKPGFVVNCQRFVDSGALSFCLGCLASLDVSVRAAAYLALILFADHLESDHTFRERYQISTLLGNLRNAVVEDCQRLPFVITLFLSKAAIQFLHPEHWIYPMVNSFFLQRPILDVADLPLFYNLFNSTAMQYKRERNWMIQLLTEGLRHVTDLHLYQRRHVLELMMSFYLSSTCDTRCKDLVCKLLRQGCQLEPCRRLLLSNLGLVPWLSHAITLAMYSSSEQQQQHSVMLVSFAEEVLATLGQSSAVAAVSHPSSSSSSQVSTEQCQRVLDSLRSVSLAVPSS